MLFRSSGRAFIFERLVSWRMTNIAAKSGESIETEIADELFSHRGALFGS